MNRAPRNLSYVFLAAASVAVFALPSLVRAQAADPNAGVEERVRAAFADAPDMIAIAKCESGFRQFSPDGTVLYGGSGKAYIGIFQIGQRLHLGPAAAMGLDIMTVEGNIAYARHLFSRSGTVPWRECVPGAVTGPAITVAPAPTPSAALTADLVLGMRHVQVRTLQQLLNAKGFAVAASGAGSSGNETDYFGALTREAVRRFQCARQIVCEGSERTTGYGRIGPRTRAALLQAPAP